MIIWGADLATQSGFCFGRPDATPTVEVVRAPVTGEDLGPWADFYLTAFQRLLERLAAERLTPEEPILVVYEAPILPERRWDPVLKKMTGGTQLATTRKLHSMGVMLEGCCFRFRKETEADVRVFECHLQSIKKEIGGSGQAAKADLVFTARKAGIVLPAGDEAKDGADAFGAWILGVRYKAPEHQRYWDTRIYAGFRLS